MKINKGDCVILKIGGPLMVVDNVSEKTEGCFCVWFDKDKAVHERWFHETILVKTSIDLVPKK